VIHHGYRRGGSGVDWSRARPALLGWCGLAVSIALLEPAGFVASFLLLTLFLVKVIYGRSFATALAVGAGASAAFWVLFAKLLQVQLPAGPWGF